MTKPRASESAVADDGQTTIKIEYFPDAIYTEHVIVTLTKGDETRVLKFSEKEFDAFYDAVVSINAEIDDYND